MRRVVMVGLSVIVVALLGVATNVATGALPARWSPYLWVAWPLVLLLVAILRQVGDGYIFVHRELLDHFAERAAADMPLLRFRAAAPARREEHDPSGNA